MLQDIGQIRAHVIILSLSRIPGRRHPRCPQVLPRRARCRLLRRKTLPGSRLRVTDPPRHLLLKRQGIRLFQDDLHIRAVRGGTAVCIQLDLARAQEHLKEILLGINIGNIPDANGIFLLIQSVPLDHDRIVLERYVSL